MESQRFVFLECPRVIVTESIMVFPAELLYELGDKGRNLRRYPIDSSENPNIVCDWLKEKNYKYEELKIYNEMTGGKASE